MAQRTRSRSDRADDDALSDDFGLVSDAEIAAFMADQEAEDAGEQEKTAGTGFWNLQTASGVGLIGVGALYSLQQIGLLPFGADLSGLVTMLPILAAVLIMLTGFGVLSWSPAARRRRKAREKAARIRQKEQNRRARQSSRTVGRDPFEGVPEALQTAGRVAASAAATAGRGAMRAAEIARAQQKARKRGAATRGKRLGLDRKRRKISGVAAGIARYTGLDPTIIRIALVAAAIFSQGAVVVGYILLSMFLPKLSDNEADGAEDDDFDDDPIVVIRG